MRKIYFLFFLILALSLPIKNSHAAGNFNVIITWHADTFYPSTYQGKPLPTIGSKINLSVEAVSDGKFVDLSNSIIEWRKNGEKIARGSGLKNSSVIFSDADRSYFVSAVVQYNGTSVEKSINLPMTSPKLVLEIPFINKVVPKESDVSITAIPYFFNTRTFNDFSFSWQINSEKKGTGNNNKITIKTGTPGTGTESVVRIDGYVQNKSSLLEIIKTSDKIIIAN